MEKFSAFRDPGTGIQPFLTPVPPSSTDALTKALLPFLYVVGIIRTGLIVLLTLIYVLLVQGICLIVLPIRPIHRSISYIFTALIARIALATIGAVWIPVEQVSRKRGRSASKKEAWSPRSGDIIISNWTSWVEILYLAFRFDPIFVLPVPSKAPVADGSPLTAGTPATGRKTGTGSAAIQPSTTRTPSIKISFAGFKRVSLVAMIRASGYAPPYYGVDGADVVEPLENIAAQADRPVVVFAEGTTSNGRGLLRFSELFGGKLPSSKIRLFLMCIRYDPPTVFAPTAAHPIPSSIINPLPHIFSLTSALALLPISVRLLPASESPNTPGVLLNEIIPAHRVGDSDAIEEACASLIAGLGRMKRVGAGWEDKVAFLDFYKSKKG